MCDSCSSWWFQTTVDRTVRLAVNCWVSFSIFKEKMARASYWNVISGSSVSRQDGGRGRKSWWMCWVLGLRCRVTKTYTPSIGPAAPEQPSAGPAHRGHRDHPQLPVLRWDQPAALGENKNSSKANASQGSESCLGSTRVKAAQTSGCFTSVLPSGAVCLQPWPALCSSN